jgi:L-fuculose-phosphate aldolase
MIQDNPLFFDDSLELRQEIIDTCLYLHDKLGFFVSTWGNVSVRLEGGLLVTPSRMSYEELEPDDLVVVSWESARIEGNRLPTSETELHRQILLERPDIGALIHSHSPYASVVASCHRSIPVLVDDMAEVIGGEVNCAKYVSAGEHKKLAQSARLAIGAEACAVLLANHGVIAGGRDLAEALVASQFVEKAAMIMILGQSLGGAKPIPDELWRAERHRYIYKYGKAEDVADILGKGNEDV